MKTVSVTFLVGLILVLVGCSSGSTAPVNTHGPGRSTTAGPSPSPSASPSWTGPSVSPSASPSRTGPLLTGAGVRPGESPPTMIDLARQDDASGALAFGAYFVAALDWSLATTDPYLLEKFSAPNCKTCRFYIDGLNRLRASGGYLTGGRTELQNIAMVNGALVPADFVVQVTYGQEIEVIYASHGALPSYPPRPGNPAINRLYLTWINGTWQLEEIAGPA
jgi:hypothetical protein